MKKLVVFTGAGISAESGIPTFRDMGGIWEKYDVTEVASPGAWDKNPGLVLEFYNQRRKKLFESEPNGGHKIIAGLEVFFDVTVITQNVDDLHERAGSSAVMHLHGELKKARSTIDSSLVYKLDNWELKLGELCEKGSQLRPHIVWFGEIVELIGVAQEITSLADFFVVVGTSLNVYPAAGLLNYVKPGVPMFLVDPSTSSYLYNNVTHINEKASTGLVKVRDKLIKMT